VDVIVVVVIVFIAVVIVEITPPLCQKCIKPRLVVVSKNKDIIVVVVAVIIVVIVVINVVLTIVIVVIIIIVEITPLYARNASDHVVGCCVLSILPSLFSQFFYSHWTGWGRIMAGRGWQINQPKR